MDPECSNKADGQASPRREIFEEWPHDFGFTTLPELPADAPRGHRRGWRRIGQSILDALGWQVVGRYPDVPKLVIAGGPHTSFWDGILAFSTVVALDLDVRVMVKASLFEGPLAPVVKWLHAIPVERSAPHGTVDQMVSKFEQCDNLVLGMAPEATRQRVDRWRTGFYRIAERASVPILMVRLDYGSRCLLVGPTIIPSGNIEADFELMQSLVADVEAKNPGSAFNAVEDRSGS